jgi:putative Mn2+ efflux pump MntP
MIVLISLIISIDSFFISSLVSGSRRTNTCLIVFSPFIHALFALIGMILEKKVLSSVSDNFLLILTLIILLAGFYIFIMYKPKKVILNKEHNTYTPRLRFLIIILTFCALDALIVGIIFGFWGVPEIQSILSIFIVNLILVLIPIIIKKVTANKWMNLK